MADTLIGITASYQPDANSKFGTVSLGDSYVQAVIQAGGVPVIIPTGLGEDMMASLFERLDGFLLTGGADVDPQRFGGEPHSRVYGVDQRRDSLEIWLVQQAVKAEKPFLGICRGIQVINVALGGTLFTDIGDQMPQALRHDWYPDIPRSHLAHTVQVTPESRLGEIVGVLETPVNSLHHQGLKQVAPALRPVAYAPDRLVEAVEVSEHPFGLAVQWHPEWLQEHAPQRQIFQALVSAASGRNGRQQG